MKKIGIIQTDTLPGDFPNNLRAIVQGYRECLDHGAELVLAPAYALCGLNPRSLMNRASFLRQQEDAAITLADELSNTNVPLLLGYGIDATEGKDLTDYPEVDSWGMEDELLHDADDTEPSYETHPFVRMTPCLIFRGNVRPIPDGSILTLQGKRCFVTTEEAESLPTEDADLIVHMPTTAWSNRSVTREDDIYSWETLFGDIPVICLHAVGAADDEIHGGGSAVYLDGHLQSRLPFFETATRIINLKGKPKASQPSTEVGELMQKALERWLRDSVRNNGYTGVCIPLDYPNSALLTAIAISALGSGNVIGATFEDREPGCISVHKLTLGDLPTQASAIVATDEPAGLTARLKGALLSTLAESRGLLLLCPLDRTAFLLGHFNLYGESCGHLAPLGNLYRMDTYLLSQRYSDRYPDLFGSLTEPEHPEQDRIIHDLTERNISAGDLLHTAGHLFRENDVRRIQRRTLASALKRYQLPLILCVEEAKERLLFPLAHRLND
ncbi:MAG: hypothetical protein IJE66_03225 [Akkermansia sp.]|nr:hypothetical protein [Akkermansia sp.]